MKRKLCEGDCPTAPGRAGRARRDAAALRMARGRIEP